MIVPGLDGLIHDVEFAFGLPAVAILLAFMRIRNIANSRSSALMLRLFLIFVLLLFIFLFCALMYRDRLLLSRLWQTSPYLWSTLYSSCILLIVASIGGLVYWQLRPERWKTT